MAAESSSGSKVVTQTTTSQETTISVTLQMPIKNLKLVLGYLNPQAYADWLKKQASDIKKTLKSGKDISEAQVEMLNHQMATSLENLIAKFKEQVCQPLKVDPTDSKEIKLFKLRANKHVISVLEDIKTWLGVSLAKTSAPDQCIDDRVKEYDVLIKELKKKIKLLQTDKLSVEIHSADDDKFETQPSRRDYSAKGETKGDKVGEKRKTDCDEFQTQHPKSADLMKEGDQRGEKNKKPGPDDKKVNIHHKEFDSVPMEN